MSKIISFATMSPDIARFIEGGLNLTNNWSEVDLDELTPDGRDTLEGAIGSIVRINPNDVDAFMATTNGLEMHEGKLRLPGGVSDPSKAAVGRRHAAAAVSKPPPAPPAPPAETAPPAPTAEAKTAPEVPSKIRRG